MNHVGKSAYLSLQVYKGNGLFSPCPGEIYPLTEDLLMGGTNFTDPL